MGPDLLMHPILGPVGTIPQPYPKFFPLMIKLLQEFVPPQSEVCPNNFAEVIPLTGSKLKVLAPLLAVNFTNILH